jgi:sporulation protein YlmC with PRC-barrel domain
MTAFTEDNLTGINHEGIYPNVPLKYLAASSIIGDHVHDEKDAHMGKIKDIMMDVATGQIYYYVIEFGGFLGIGEKYFAIPFSLLRIDPIKRIFIFTESKETLAKAPGFNHWHWPDADYHLVEDFWHFV